MTLTEKMTSIVKEDTLISTLNSSWYFSLYEKLCRHRTNQEKLCRSCAGIHSQPIVPVFVRTRVQTPALNENLLIDSHATPTATSSFRTDVFWRTVREPSNRQGFRYNVDDKNASCISLLRFSMRIFQKYVSILCDTRKFVSRLS